MQPPLVSRRFSTKGLPEAKQVALWQEQFGRNMLRLDMRLTKSGPLNAEATLRALPGLRTVNCSSSVGVSFIRSRELLDDGEDSVGIVVNLAPRAVASQRDQEFSLALAEGVSFFTASVATLTTTRHVGLLFPRSALAARVPRLDAIHPRKIPSGSEALRLLTSYVRTVQGKLSLDNARLEAAVVGHIHDLAALVLEPNPKDRDASLGAVAAARLEAVLTVIGRRFAEHDLSLTEVARSQNVSPRYVQYLLETTGKSFSDRLSELRLAHARTLLQNGAETRRVGEIARAAGFSDISYFNRLFRARFGDTPRGMRGTARHAVDRKMPHPPGPTP